MKKLYECFRNITMNKNNFTNLKKNELLLII